MPGGLFQFRINPGGPTGAVVESLHELQLLLKCHHLEVSLTNGKALRKHRSTGFCLETFAESQLLQFDQFH